MEIGQCFMMEFYIILYVLICKDYKTTVSAREPSSGVPYSLNQMPLSISSRSRIEATAPDVLNEIVAALEY